MDVKRIKLAVTYRSNFECATAAFIRVINYELKTMV